MALQVVFSVQRFTEVICILPFSGFVFHIKTLY